MKKLLFIILMASLTGCNKLSPFGLMSSNGATLHKEVILVIGQSQNVRFEQYGEIAFVRDYAKVRATSQIQFINCAVGGTSIDQWQANGQWMNVCNTGGLKPTAILFYQGEADAAMGTANWAQQFTSAANGWRAMFGNIPIIYAQLAIEDPTIYCPQSNWDSIKQQQMEVFLPKVTMIKTDDISELDPDPIVAQGVHLSQASYPRIAERYVAALTTLEDK